jgi:hypothetical protein
MTTLLYVGEDASFVESLERWFPDSRVAVLGRSLDACVPAPETILVLDLNCGAALDQISACRACCPQSPLVVVSDVRPDTLTAMALARTEGAECYFLKPVKEVNSLVAAVRSAASRLERWQKQLQSLAPPSENAE